MTAGNSRALWWRPPTRAAWRVQQAALARVKWLREDARRMDSTTGGLIWIWPTSKNKQSTSAAVHRDQRNGRQRIAQRRRKRCDMEKGIGKAQKREQERNNKEQQMEQRPRDETDRPNQRRPDEGLGPGRGKGWEAARLCAEPFGGLEEDWRDERALLAW
ncbi:predicted protein [Chaetomium globosum CBS 148.51]|uniref:Uncharacterized protein n=1 Tax=Chaetomium globosum (strain ATCC 6205 / CBS 148.51 / DSM 1962 / NBRC 6347 / NRRL 1970) TaxID=306901 RepID=Q2GXY7_CHAGB|nr:uncharacterized protein CHGG_07167 [Chaetomium globosum CBS 148.51]EAQ85914.1 predicted protein [Chaetomium globosum CBS 148.51]